MQVVRRRPTGPAAWFTVAPSQTGPAVRFTVASRAGCEDGEGLENERLATSPLVVTELDHLVHRDLGFPAAMQVMEALNSRMDDGQYRLTELKLADLRTAQEVRRKYEGLRLDLADAVGVVLADRYRTDRIFTLDQRDFRAMAPLTPGLDAFRILPADS